VRVHPVAQVVLDAERHPARDQPPRHAEREPDQAGGQNGERERPEVAVALANLVDRAADQERDQRARAHRHRREREGDDHATPVRAQEAEESPEGAHPSYFTF